MQKSQKVILQSYLNGFKVSWIDDSENDTRFEITKCVWYVYYIDVSGEPHVYPEYINVGTMITVDTASDPEFKGQREYFDSNGLLPSSQYDDPYLSFTSQGYCYRIRALNSVGASSWIETECRRL